MSWLRMFRWGLPALWLLAYLAGIRGGVGTFLFLGAVAAWAWPLLGGTGSVGTAARPTRPDSSPLASSFDATPAPDATWTRFTVYPARGKGPITTLPGFIGAVGIGIGVVWLVGSRFKYDAPDSVGLLLLLVGIAGFLAANWVIHRPYLAGYRSITAAPNAFDVGPAGLKVGGATLDRASILKLRLANPITQAQMDARPVASGWVAGGTGTVGAAAAVGTALGGGMAQAAAIQGAQLRARTAQHAWVLDAIDTRGQAHRLAGGLTQNTMDALVHAIQQHLES